VKAAALGIVVTLATGSAFGGAGMSAPTRVGGKILLRGAGLYSVNPDGSGLRRIAADLPRPGQDVDAIVEDAAWSPDGKRVAFTRYGAGLFVARGDGTSARRLTRGLIDDPSWSPDGRSIVFSKGNDLDVARTDGRVRVLVKGSDARWGVEPRWSRDGTHIAFVKRFDPRLGTPDQLWVVRPDGSGKRRVATANEEESIYTAPDWSADSHWIAYATEFVNGDVYLVRPNGTGKVNLTPSHDALDGPRWAPIGDTIAYSARLPCGMLGPTEPCFSSQIVIHRTRTAPRERIDEDEFAHDYGFAWSADASRLVFNRLLIVDEGVFMKRIGEPGLTLVISGDWVVLDWARK